MAKRRWVNAEVGPPGATYSGVMAVDPDELGPGERTAYAAGFKDGIAQSAAEIERLRDDLARVRSVYDFARLEDEIKRLRAGIRQVREYLEQQPPRIGDATFACAALVADSHSEEAR